MSLWKDISHGRGPWKSRITPRNAAKRLGFALPFLLFGGFVAYQTSNCSLELSRESSGSVTATARRSFAGIPYLIRSIEDLSAIDIETESRLVEKDSIGESSPSRASLTEKTVSRLVMHGPNRFIPVSEFRYDSGALHSDVAQQTEKFLATTDRDKFEASLPFQGAKTPIRVALAFLLGLGGFLLFGVLFDTALLVLQRSKKSRR